MLEAAEGALHHEICEFLHGPESTLQETIEPGSCFGGPPNLVVAAQEPTGFSRGLQYGSLSTSLESCSTTGPLEIWGTTDTRASLPVQPRTMYDFSSNLLNSGYPSIPTAAGNESPLMHSFQRRLRVQKAPIMKPKRSTGKAEHILRERLRRDDMTCKFQMLESLLPPGPKRDRATIVEDSIRHVTNLHDRMKDLQQKRSEMRRMGKHRKHAQEDTDKNHTNNNRNRSSKGGGWQAGEIDKTKKGVGENNGSERSCIENVEVHLHLPEGIVIEMTCRPHAHIQSQVLGALERLGLEVSQCSISITHGRILCSIVAQPRSTSHPLLTKDVIIQALKRAMGV